ncbi:hypothetical protein [Tengunoibacter tsumagoiensis]|uniref:ABC transporter permease n=1 Tax=Tengunoibacter tsumagoiensis TaxID=2014871 RepID=A0A401ZY76_9CHLR|nr:hypothetical protein [Tengunoibacter tsumagoiensis]GCE11806.1 hypothetical protein KTT_16650 [Tengunoibacter tsumagoiensis]
MNGFSVFLGTFLYEFRMQVRRPALWLTFLLCSLVLTLTMHDLLTFSLETPLTVVISHWLMLLNTFFPIVFSFFLADRFIRDQRIKVTELFETVVPAYGARLFGKYLGCCLATLVPIFLFYSLGIALILLHARQVQVPGLALEMFVALVVPEVLFVGAFSMAIPVCIPLPVYQFLFVGYWFWGNIFPPYPHTPFPIPTLSGTILTPIGSYISAGLFGVPAFAVNQASVVEGHASLVVLLVCPVVVMCILIVYARWQPKLR